jgi:H+/Cl- antiporter ClcA
MNLMYCFFYLKNYWKGFLAALSGSIMRQIVSLIRESEGATFHPLFPTFFETISFSYVELFAFALLGLLMGVLGAAYVTCSGIFRVWWKKWNKRHPFLWACILLVCIDFILFFPGEYSRFSVLGIR